MQLREHIKEYPRTERHAARERIGKACGVSPLTVRAWETGQRDIHPRYFPMLKSATGGAVTLADYYPQLSNA